jgi:hypothetical protein
MPFMLDDLRWMDDAYRAAFYGLASAFGITPADSFVLSGCALTIGIVGSDYQYDNTAGYICLAGEIFAVDAQTGLLITPGNTARWDVVTSNDAAGAKVFADGTTYQTYQVRKARLISSADTSKMPAAAPTLISKIRSLTSYATAWVMPTLEAAYTNVSGQEVAYRKNTIGNLEIRGNFTASSADGKLFTLPVNFRPAIPVRIPIIYDPITPGSSDGFVTIETNGDVVLSDAAATGGKVNSLQVTVFL